jgi:hypothetical protein
MFCAHDTFLLDVFLKTCMGIRAWRGNFSFFRAGSGTHAAYFPASAYGLARKNTASADVFAYLILISLCISIGIPLPVPAPTRADPEARRFPKKTIADPGTAKYYNNFRQRRCIYLSHTYVFVYQYRYPATGTGTGSGGSGGETFSKEKLCRSRRCEVLQQLSPVLRPMLLVCDILSSCDTVEDAYDSLLTLYVIQRYRIRPSFSLKNNLSPDPHLP